MSIIIRQIDHSQGGFFMRRFISRTTTAVIAFFMALSFCSCSFFWQEEDEAIRPKIASDWEFVSMTAGGETTSRSIWEFLNNTASDGEEHPIPVFVSEDGETFTFNYGTQRTLTGSITLLEDGSYELDPEGTDAMMNAVIDGDTLIISIPVNDSVTEFEFSTSSSEEQ